MGFASLYPSYALTQMEHDPAHANANAEMLINRIACHVLLPWRVGPAAHNCTHVFMRAFKQ